MDEIISARYGIESDTLAGRRTDRKRIEHAFAELEAQGWVARMAFECCGSCGATRLAHEGHEDDAVVWYNEQSDENSFGSEGMLVSTLWLCWNETDENPATEVKTTLERHGLRVTLADSMAGCIAVESAFPD